MLFFYLPSYLLEPVSIMCDSRFAKSWQRMLLFQSHLLYLYNTIHYTAYKESTEHLEIKHALLSEYPQVVRSLVKLINNFPFSFKG